MHADQAWIITAALVTLTGVIGWAFDRYVLVWSWWPLIGSDWRAGRRAGRALAAYQEASNELHYWELDHPEPPEDDEPQDDWADELHVINLAVHRDRPIAQLTHYEIEAVIKDLGRADWLPERYRAAA